MEKEKVSKEKIQEFIAKDELDEALDMLKNSKLSHVQKNELILLRSRYASLMKNERLGLLSDKTERRQLQYDILQYTDSLYANESFYQPKKNRIWVILVSLLITIPIILYINYEINRSSDLGSEYNEQEKVDSTADQIYLEDSNNAPKLDPIVKERKLSSKDQKRNSEDDKIEFVEDDKTEAIEYVEAYLIINRKFSNCEIKINENNADILVDGVTHKKIRIKKKEAEALVNIQLICKSDTCNKLIRVSVDGKLPIICD